MRSSDAPVFLWSARLLLAFGRAKIDACKITDCLLLEILICWQPSPSRPRRHTRDRPALGIAKVGQDSRIDFPVALIISLGFAAGL